MFVALQSKEGTEATPHPTSLILDLGPENKGMCSLVETMQGFLAHPSLW